MKKSGFLLAAMLVTAIASPLIVSTKDTVPLSEISAGALDSYIEKEFEKTHIPNMSVAVVDADGVYFAKSYGEGGDLDSPYILGSISKSFTAVAIMQLAEQGKVDIMKPMAEYLPMAMAGGDSKTTVKQLLNQTSGIHTYMTLENYKTSDAVADWEYANVNYNLLGQIVENVSGVSYGDYIKTHIFQPLEMTNSHASLEEAKAGGLIGGYRNYFGFMVKDEVKYPKDTTSGWMTVPAAYVISTANDMGRYLQFYLNGGKGVLSPESIKAMQGDTVFAQTDYQYGYGWGVDGRADETILTHGGNVENYTTDMFILPERGLAGIVLFNACDYLVANGMAVQLPYNIAYKLMGIETTDIGESTYVLSHHMINAVLLLVGIISLLPLIRIKKWCAKNRSNLSVKSTVFLILVHVGLPTLIMTAVAILGNPMWVVARFAPDIFMVQILSSAVLYLTGIVKVIYSVCRSRKQMAATL